MTLLAAGLSGGLAPLGVPGLPDPGVVTRVALPTVQVLRDMVAMGAVGALVVAATCVPPAHPGKDENRVRGIRGRLVLVAQLCATAWVVADGALLALVYADASGTAPRQAGFWSEVVFFARSYELGQYLLWGAALAAVVAVGSALLQRTSTLGLVTATALVALWPIALTGHAAGTLNHNDAVNLQMVHLVGISVWFGGLLALALIWRQLGPSLASVVRRYSVLAGWGLVLVSASGLAGAWLRLPSPGAAWSSYGALLAAKVGAVACLAAAGWWHRHHLIDRLDRTKQDSRDTGDTGGTGGAGKSVGGAFARLVVVELVVLAGAAGIGVALSRTAPPAPAGGQEPLTTAQSMLGTVMPPALDAAGWFTRWNLDTLFLPIAVGAIAWYLIGVRRLRRRGVAWSWLRTASWVTGWLLFIWATNGAPNTYGRVLFSMHMVQHMTIATAVPTFLVLGTPVTLALRTLRRRTDGSRGPREWLLQLVHSLPAQLLGHPVVASALFVVGMVAFYYSSLFETSLEAHTAHVLMTVHFMASGYLFAEVIVGDDPGLQRPPYPLRALLVMITFGFHALFSVTLMSSSRILAEDWFAALGRDWGDTLAGDQYLGASIGWGMGEYPLLVMAIALLISWVRADGRERRRFDRREDRENGRQLAQYNDYLRQLSAAGKQLSPPTMTSSGETTTKDSSA
ncbi:cytochrome c oxidase assembly protein [Nocardioides sp. Arc9.136]|uniref:cytochrome c oxidase assembly protein n=1 Tax=Nocardioides sp. Arc9.136 TaxID=2996826 RepID=UPI00266577DE|nr:cytochrome c oxidase assembly protein [Nocardioides sp. Arc9.136]WKN46612.1 cytochrome c oxidase assembly protein [Nocardioides sp. Arc9.136]